MAPTGRLYSCTTTERELRPGFEPPYTVVVVDLGTPMHARFDKVHDEVTLVQWEPVPA